MPRTAAVPATPRWATRREVARYVRLCDRTIDSWIAKGVIRAYRLPGGRNLAIDLNEVDELIRSRGPVVPSGDAA